MECVTPDILQSRLYRRSFLGELLAHELAESLPKCPHKLVDDQRTLYAWIQAGKYRRLVLRVMVEPMTAKQIRKAVMPHFERIGANHVHTVLRHFAHKSVARRLDDGRWLLTALGRRMRDVDAEGLGALRRPPVPDAWSKVVRGKASRRWP